MKIRDNWNRNKMRCKNCTWYIKKGKPPSTIGRCRRHAPSVNGYPVVFEDDCCGDHRVSEEEVK